MKQNRATGMQHIRFEWLSAERRGSTYDPYFRPWRRRLSAPTNARRRGFLFVSPFAPGGYLTPTRSPAPLSRAQKRPAMHTPKELIADVTWTHVTVPAGELIFGTPAAGPPQKVWFHAPGDRYVIEGYVN